MKKGFTLIELLVVISIIGMLGSIILVSLTSARDRGRIAAGLQFEANTYHAYGANAVGTWRMNEGSGTVAKDDSQYRFDANFSGSPTWVPGIDGTALHFDGTNSIVLNTDLRARTDLIGGDTGGAFMISAWVRPTSYDGINYRLIANGFPGFLYFGINPQEKLILMVNNGANDYWPTSTGTIPLNKWSHVAFFLQAGKGYQFYIDGKLDIDVSLPTIQAKNMSSTNPTGIGASWQLDPHYFVGDIDNVRYYNTL